MLRHAAVVVAALCLTASSLHAQGSPQLKLTVNTASADLHKTPSTGSPVVGKAPRGAVLEVTREVGDWVKVTWKDARDGAYVHLSTGALSRGATPQPNRATGSPSAQAARETRESTLQTRRLPAASTGAVAEPAPRTQYVSTPRHVVGIGGQMTGSTLGYGATARTWARPRIGIQFDVSRSSYTSPAAPGRLTSVQFAPSVLYSLADRVTDYVWLRPYAGAGFNLHRQTLSGAIPDAADSLSDSSFGVQTFGGVEATFAGVPRLAVSADVGYRWLRTPFEGFDVGGIGFSVSARWYVR